MKKIFIITLLVSSYSFGQSVFSPKSNPNSLGIAESFKNSNSADKPLPTIPLQTIPFDINDDVSKLLPSMNSGFRNNSKTVTDIRNNNQSYLGFVKQTVNLRKGPGTDFNIIKSLPTGTQIFVISTDKKNNYYNVIDLETNVEGYIYNTYVEFDKAVNINEDDLFVESGKSSFSTVSEVKVYNNTNKTLTVFIGGSNYLFSAQEKRSINIKPNEYNYRVTAPGVIPYLGKDKVKAGYNYSWEFYIVAK